MRRSLYMLSTLVLGAMFFFSGCSKSDDNGSGAQVTADPIEGTWISDGTDVCIGLKSALKTKNIVATFNANKSYTVVATDSSNVSVTYTGTYSTTENTGSTIRTITLNQSTPTSVTSTGIYQVVNGKLTYEVIQTTPAITGWSAPTAAGGFGSTSYNNVKYAIYVQGYVAKTPTTDPIIGSWLSEGTNVAIGLRSALKTKKITAQFNANGSYTVIATDSSNASVTYTGTFSSQAATSTSMRTITLNQSTPTSVTSTGIYQVTTTGLTYEVIQTTPAINGWSAPTIAGGFGSTSYNTVKYPIYIQKFVTQ